MTIRLGGGAGRVLAMQTALYGLNFRHGGAEMMWDDG
jgi:hypothetical protein